MTTTTKPVKPGMTRRERRQDEAMRAVNRLTELREATIAKLVKTEGKLIEARRALARVDKAIAKEKAERRKIKRGIGSVLAQFDDPPAPKPSAPPKAAPPKAAPPPAASDDAARAARPRAELQGDRPGRRRQRAETPAG